MPWRRLIGFGGLLLLAASAPNTFARPPVQRLADPSPGSGGSNLCFEWHEVDPEGNIGPAVTEVMLRNGQGKMFLKKPCGWTP